MTPPLLARTKLSAPTDEALRDQAAALRAALDQGGDQLDAHAVALARQVIDKVGERSALAGNHTVVALAGATGSGKSSLFNALAGDDLAEVGARRPTTASPTAAVWGRDSAGELLDWLGVSQRHGLPAAAAGDDGLGSLDGLVLLDLPDFDSREASHRAEAERVLGLCDVFVWVTDPQKYADALLHDEYLRRLRGHSTVMLVVLNHADRLSPDALEQCRQDLARLLHEDGARGVQVVTTSVVTGRGIAELRRHVADAVAGHVAARRRLSADLGSVSARLHHGVADREPKFDPVADDRLVAALSRASGVPVVLEAVEADYRREAAGRTGWVFTRWGRKLRADPLRRLRLDRAPEDVKARVDPADVRQVLGRSSIPAPSPSARSAVTIAAHELVERAAEGLPAAWAEAVADAAAPTRAALYERLDRAVVSTPLRARPPAWWRLMGWLQWVCAVATVAGAVWLALLGVLGRLQLPQLDTPKAGGVPVPTLLLVAGLVLGLLAAWTARVLARIGARRRRSRVGRRLRAAITDVATKELVRPVQEVLDRHRRTRELLEDARRA